MMWKKTFKKVWLYLVLSFLVLFLLFCFNQVMNLYRNLAVINPSLAVVVTALVGVLLLLILLLPIYGFMRYPKLEELPDGFGTPEHSAFLALQAERLRRNKYLLSVHFDFSQDNALLVESANTVLKRRADEMVKTDASAVFLTTAVSQNGVLDGLSVLIALLKLVYNLSTLYENRPNMNRIIYLYGQVAAVVLIARSVEDMDLIEDQVEPLMTSLLGGSVISLIPGAVGVTNLIVNSVVEGAVNALLTLRVGYIAERYLSAQVKFDKKKIRRSASLEATKSLGSILGENAVLVVKSFAKATKDSAKSALKLPWRRA